MNGSDPPTHTDDRRGLVRRERLEPLGQRVLEYRITSVVAPAGYGKTVWVSELMRRPEAPASAWVSLDRPDASPAFLLRHMIRSIGAGQADEAWRTLMSLENVEAEWPIAAASFLEALQGSRLTLVLDDVDFLYNSPTAVEMIDFILAHLPEQIHAILIARNAPPFKLYQYEIENQLLRVGSGALLFSKEETLRLFAAMGLQLSDGDAATLYGLTDGWAVGLRLLGVYLQQPGGCMEDALRGLKQKDSGFGQYFIHEFLGSMPAEMRQFMTDASLLPYLESGLCDAALGRADSKAMLEALRAFGLLNPLPEEKEGWQMHHLVRSWLQDIAAGQSSREYANNIRARTAQFFHQKGDISRAVEQCILAERLDRAASLIHEYGHDYSGNGLLLDELHQWIGQLPERVVENDCWLLYFKGTCMLHVENAPAFRVLASAADLAEKHREPKCEASAILTMLMSAVACGDAEMGEMAGRRLLRRPELMENPDSHAEALAAAIQYAAARDNLREGLRLSREAMRLPMRPETEMWVRCTESYLLLRVGNLPEARRIIDGTLAAPYVRENERRLIVGYEILNDIAFMMADFPIFDGACRVCAEHGGKYAMIGIQGRAHYLRGQFFNREGRYADALRELNLAYGCYTSAGIVHFANQAAIEILQLRINGGENAGELLPQFLELKSRFERVPYGLGIDYMVNTSCGIAAMDAGQLDLAGQLLEKSALRWREIGADISMAGTNLLLAHLNLLKGNEEACDSLLREALSAAETWRWVNFWDWHPSTMYAMCLRAVIRDIHAGWAAHLLQRWFPTQSRQAFSLLLAASNRQLSELAAGFFDEDFRSGGKPVFSVFFLGGFRLFINGTEVPKAAWKTKKAEDLFKCVVADRRACGKDYLMQQLWPEGDPDSNDGKLRMTLSYVRKALAAEGLTGGCISVHRGQIRLDPGIEVHCDYKYFMEAAGKALQYAKAGHPYAIPELEWAAAIYTGEFLPENLYEDFTGTLRDALHNLHLELLAQLARLRVGQNNLPAALEACQRYLAQEPVDETIVRLAMKVLWKMRKKHRAIELYLAVKDRLARDYNTSPEQETAALYRKIQSGAACAY